MRCWKCLPSSSLHFNVGIFNAFITFSNMFGAGDEGARVDVQGVDEDIDIGDERPGGREEQIQGVSREGEEEVPSRTTTIRAETPPPTRRTARHERRHHQRTRTTPEREAKDVARTRNHEVETEGGGVQSRIERVEGPLEAAKTKTGRGDVPRTGEFDIRQIFTQIARNGTKHFFIHRSGRTVSTNHSRNSLIFPCSA
jgi:hypothetical protein